MIRTVADIRTLQVSPKLVKRLPPDGPVVALPGLDAAACEAFRRQIARYARACGCAAGGMAFLITAGACAANAAYAALHRDWGGVARAVAAGAILAPAIMVAAKLISLRLERHRFRRDCARVIRSLPAAAEPPQR